MSNFRCLALVLAAPTICFVIHRLSSMAKHLKLLSLGADSRIILNYCTDWLTDGGGIRGVSMLVILDEIMRRVQHDKGLTSPPRPCEYFHLIGGTSTGGYAASSIELNIAHNFD